LQNIRDQIDGLIRTSNVRVSEHGYDELAEDGLTAREIILGFGNAELIEEYPDYPKGPCILVLQRDRNDKPVHVVWGIPKGYTEPAVLITAYHPDPSRWNSDFMKRN
jgi:hypothetical protein